LANHVHLVLVPSDTDGLRRALATVHRSYAGVVHARRRRGITVTVHLIAITVTGLR
jgi:hypothetical protein